MFYRNEYPRPDLVRDNWLNLNGSWAFAFDDNKVGHLEQWFLKHDFNQKINVPFAFQTILSGINDPSFHDHLWYQKSLKVPSTMRNKRVFLRFEAVDYYAEVYVNGKLVGSHTGGQTGFGFEITDFLTWEQENVVVYAHDPSTDEYLPRGKQYWKEKPESIWYNRTSGIWQTVWLQALEIDYVKHVQITPLYDEGKVEFSIEVTNASMKPRLILNNKEIDVDFQLTEQNKLVAKYKLFHTENDFYEKSWSPDNPYLFDLAIEYGQDRLSTYFGMRKISTKDGRIYLNNRAYYLKLVLDQGYFRQGLLTPPTIDILKQDILIAKALGFNGARKHQKVEDKYYLYYADKLGFLVWGEMASSIKFSELSAKRDMNEWKQVLPRDYNHPSIIAWVPLNESWGVPEINEDKRQQQHSLDLYYYVKKADPTRLVISNDGWELTKSDICAVHNYRHGALDDEKMRAQFRHDLSTKEAILASRPADRPIYAKGFEHRGEPIMLTEFGGISLVVDAQGWGYTSVNNSQTLIDEYERILNDIANSTALAGYCYTQLYDVEVEVNGLLTYDRLPKVNPKIIKHLNERFPDYY